MGSWQRFGRFISGHMLVIVPLCLLAGVLFPQQLSRISPFVPALFALMTFQGALTSSFCDLWESLRHPAPLLAALALTLVAMPALACVLGELLFGDPELTCGLVLEYSVPVGVVSIMWIDIFEGDVALGLATLMVSTLLAPLSIPTSLTLLVGASVSMDPVSMMREMLLMIALPALAGMALNQLSHGWGATTLSPALSPACRVLLILIITANSTGISDCMLHLTPRLVKIMAFVAAYTSCGFLAGLGLSGLMGLDERRAVSFTFDCGLRNISAGAVIASRYFGPAVMFPVMMGTLCQQFLPVAFGSLLRGHFRRGEGRPALGPPA